MCDSAPPRTPPPQHPPHTQGCIRRKGASEAAPEAVSQAVAGGCQSGYCQLQMPLKLALGVRGTVAGHRLRALGGYLPRFQCIPAPPSPSPAPALRNVLH